MTLTTSRNHVIGDVNESRGRGAQNGSAVVDQSTYNPSKVVSELTNSIQTSVVQPSATMLPVQQQQHQQLVSDVSDATRCCENDYIWHGRCNYSLLITGHSHGIDVWHCV